MRTVPSVLLKDFRQYIESKLENKGTADRYYYSVCRFFKEYGIDDLTLVTPELVLDGLASTRGQNGTSALKMGLQHLKAWYPALRLPSDAEIQEVTAHKRNRSVRPPKTIYLEEVRGKVMGLRNQKLKLAYLLMMASGLRVGETAALEKQDIRITPDGITVNVRHGKGGSNGLVHCMRDSYLEKKLSAYLTTLPDEEQPFYAKGTMVKRAVELGLECHDFRRIAAIQYRQDKMVDRRHDPLNAPSVKEIDEETKDFLRHARFSTTKRYLYNRKLRVKLPEPKTNAEKGGQGK